jgi:hypothetical protein
MSGLAMSRPQFQSSGFWQLFSAPSKFFQSVNGRTSWIWGSTIAMAIAVATLVIELPLNTQIQNNILYARHLHRTARVESALAMARDTSFVMAPLGILAAIVFVAGLFWLLGLIFADVISFGKVLAVSAYAHIILGLDGLIGISMNYLMDWRDAENSLHVRTTFLSVGAFVNLTDRPAALAVSNTFGLLAFWYWGLLVIGMASISKLTKRQSVCIVVFLVTLSALMAYSGGLMKKVIP